MVNSSPKLSRSRRKEAFTLIELLMVIAVILLLAGITVGITRGVQNAQAGATVRAELAVIAQALETYKSKHGDYPWVNTSSVKNDTQIEKSSHGLMKTLVGWQSVTGTQVGEKDEATNLIFKKQKSTLDVSKLSLSQEWPSSRTEASPSSSVYFVDPWGRPYVYCYKNPSVERATPTWERFGYILFSRGPDGDASSASIEESTGEILPTFNDEDENIDNIFVGE